MRILRMIVALKTSEICVGVAIDTEIVSKVKNKTTGSCAIEIAPDTLEGSFVGTIWSRSVPYTLVDFKCIVRMTVPHEVQQYTNHCCIIECNNSRFTNIITRQG